METTPMQPKPTRDADYYAAKLVTAVTTLRQRLWNMQVIVNACRDYFHGRTTFPALQTVIEQANTFDKMAQWRGVPYLRAFVVQRPLTANPNRKSVPTTKPGLTGSLIEILRNIDERQMN